jgi:hypothetical protein
MNKNMDLFLQSRVADYVFLDIRKFFPHYKSFTTKEGKSTDPPAIKELVDQKRAFMHRVEKVYGPQTESFVGILS